METAILILSVVNVTWHILKAIPGTHDPSVLYWYEFVPGKNPQWIPHLVDDASGIGNNFEVQDINNDKLLILLYQIKKEYSFLNR